MKINFTIKYSFILLIAFLFLNSCGKNVDAKKFPPDPKERIKKNLEEGKGFRLSTKLKSIGKGGGDFEFASSNELWRASLDVIDFMPLATANYSGGIIVTDWYSDNVNSNESLINEFMRETNVILFFKNSFEQSDLIGCEGKVIGTNIPQGGVVSTGDTLIFIVANSQED